MGFFARVKQRFLGGSKALRCYKQGILRARLHDREGAISDYTAAIDMDDGPSNLRAMALFNRALCYAANHNETSAIDDLNMVIAMETAPGDVRTAARQKLQRMDRRSESNETT